ncbi:hypothetical protein [Zemynaea arenosa]|nr:hypothetical protein [Massilia arenosa]
MNYSSKTARLDTAARPAARRAAELKQLQMVAIGTLTGGLLMAFAILLMR